MSTPDPGGHPPRPAGPKPVFVDPTGRRGKNLQALAVGVGGVMLLVIVFFTLSLLAIPALPHLPGLGPEARRAARPAIPPRPARGRLLEARERRNLMKQIAEDQRRQGAARAAAAPHTGADSSRARHASPPPAGRVITAAFYAGWQESGIHSLRANADHLTHLFPVWLRVDAEGQGLDTRDWDPGLSPRNVEVLQICRDRRIEIHPVLSNAHEGVFDSTRAHRLLSDPVHQDRLARATRDWLVGHGFRGLNVDLENLQAEDVDRVPGFLTRLRRAFAHDSLTLSFDLAIEGRAPQAASVAHTCDFFVLMGYDQHSRYNPAGALCGARWFEGALDHALESIPASKLVCGIGGYAYDWTNGKPPADPLTYQQAVSEATDEHPDDTPEDIVDFDPRELNATFEYTDDAGRPHEVWMLDAISAANERTLALDRGVHSTAVWVLGSEDPDLWGFVDRAHPEAPPDSSRLSATHYPFDVDFVGDGELLSVHSEPKDGQRTLERDRTTGLFTDESYHRFPSPFVLAREGYQPKAIALTFDDGPAYPWTGEVLDELARDSVKATFFVVGRNAELHPDLIHRIWNESHEIGNHTFTHPNLAAISPRQAQLELTATQRVIEAELGRSTVLFRPPYNADAEPASAEEVTPIIRAADLGYVTVGETLDPEDWQLEENDSTGTPRQRTAADIANAVLQKVADSRGNAVLLHDGGGDRSRTVNALRILIPELKREGYHFVTVSTLIGLGRDQVMPALGPRDRAVRGVDRVTFEAAFVVETFLYWAFLTAIGLGTARVLWVTTLALLAARAQARRTPPEVHGLSVGVLIAAFNEERVIAATVRAALASDVPPTEVIVVDDGSKDDTSGEVEKIAAVDPRVRLVRQTNAGKAAAMNRALAESHSDVLVCLDADTVIASDAIGRLVRHFGDARVAAVAGNVKVGNHVNLWTRWQSIEYIVSQNLDRRANGLLNAISVVPGAVGAWRRTAIAEVGGLQSDTLAEDMDLTWRLRRAGWTIENETEAFGYTEVPDSMASLLQQRFRWTYGTLQCLWKHRGALGRYGWFGRVGLPSLWLFQIGYQLLSPIVDLQVVLTLITVGISYVSGVIVTREWQPLPQAIEACTDIVTMFGLFFLLELMGGLVAYRLDRERKRDLFWLFWQRFIYRQIMYGVALRSIAKAIGGRRAGWGKLERQGTAQATTT
ncbi:MAG: glycosyltransferase [Candidatus Eisenbacteria bacterium]|nr:glycosyltransferase [Candidatus Eisenbacteria bacterium]